MYWYQYRESGHNISTFWEIVWLPDVFMSPGTVVTELLFLMFHNYIDLDEMNIEKRFPACIKLMLLIKASVNILRHFQCGMKNFTGDKHTSPIFPQHAHLPLGNTTGCLLRH